MCTAKWVIVAIGGASAVVIIMSMSIYFSSSGSNEIDLGDGDDTSIAKESNGINLIEVDASNSQGWSWFEIGFEMGSGWLSGWLAGWLAGCGWPKAANFQVWQA